MNEHARPTEAQLRLLAEIQEAGTLYVRRYSRWSRTIDGLLSRGLIRLSEPDYSSYGADGYVVTDPPA